MADVRNAFVTDRRIQLIKNAIADPNAPWYGSDFVAAVSDLVEVYQFLREHRSPPKSLNERRRFCPDCGGEIGVLDPVACLDCHNQIVKGLKASVREENAKAESHRLHNVTLMEKLNAYFKGESVQDCNDVLDEPEESEIVSGIFATLVDEEINHEDLGQGPQSVEEAFALMKLELDKYYSFVQRGKNSRKSNYQQNRALNALIRMAALIQTTVVMYHGSATRRR